MLDEATCRGLGGMRAVGQEGQEGGGVPGRVDRGLAQRVQLRLELGDRFSRDMVLLLLAI